ncbi:MAG TPA: hypothetical protein VHQ90_03690 [Thermoanaerobaculia bacterium]|nr:hypothetical protein [Thermoanaerobaculia bacterium]
MKRTGAMLLVLACGTLAAEAPAAQPLAAHSVPLGSTDAADSLLSLAAPPGPDGGPGATQRVGSGVAPRVSVFPDGAFVVAWRGPSSHQGAAPTLFARLFDRNGVPTSDAIELLPPVHRSLDSVAALPGGFVVVWSQLLAHQLGVFARLFDLAGSPLGGPFKVHADSPFDRCCALAVAAPGGGFEIEWSADQNRFHGMVSQVVRQAFDAAGLPQGPEPVDPPELPGPVDGDSFEPLAALVAGHGTLTDVAIAYGSGTDLYLSRFVFGLSAGRSVNLDTVDLYGYKAFRPTPAVSFAADGDFVVVWPTGGFFSLSSSILAHRYSGRDGSLLEHDPVQISLRSGLEVNPAVAAVRGGYVVAWTELDGSNPDRKPSALFARWFKNDGIPASREFRLSGRGASNPDETALAATPGGDVVAVWAQDDPGRRRGVHLRILRAPAD